MPTNAAPSGLRGDGFTRSTASPKRRGETHSASQPSPSWPARIERRVRPASDKDRDRYRGRGTDRAAEVEEPPAELDLLSLMNRRTHRSASVVRAPRSRGSIPHSSSSLGSSPPTPTPNVNLPGSEQRDRGELASHDRRVTQRHQVHTGLHRQTRVCGQERGRLDQAVGAVAVGEADVVADGQVVDAGVDARARRAPPTGRTTHRGPARAGRSRPGWDRRRPPRSPPRCRETYAEAVRSAVAVAAACNPNTSAHARPPAYARLNTPPASAPAASSPGITWPDSSSTRA